MVFVLISSNFPSCGVLSSASISAWVKNFGKRRRQPRRPEAVGGILLDAPLGGLEIEERLNGLKFPVERRGLKAALLERPNVLVNVLLGGGKRSDPALF